MEMTSTTKVAQPFETGIVVISLDTELGWGRINSGEYQDIADVLNRGKLAIEKLINLFEKYRIPVTWAIVGQLFRKNPPQDDSRLPSTPTLSIDTSTPWKRGWWRAPELIRQIRQSDVSHEIGSHSGSHILFDHVTPEQARDDIVSFINWSETLSSTRPTSHVFPQNKVSHLDVLLDLGFESFRGNPPVLGHGPVPTTFLPRREQGLVNIPGTVSYRPSDQRTITSLGLRRWFKSTGTNSLPMIVKLASLRLSVKHASHAGKVCHVVLHPKDFALNENLLSGFESWLSFLQDMRREGKIDVLTMKEVAERAEFG